MNQLLGLQKSKFSLAGMRGQKIYSSGSSAGASLDAEKTFITTRAGEVAVVDLIDLSMVASQDFGAANYVATVTIGTQTMNFVLNGLTTRNRRTRYKIRPKGTIVVPPSSTLKISSSATTFAASASVKYRVMQTSEATIAGYYTQTPWYATSGPIAFAGTPQSITGFAAADVGTSRYLEINGIAITGAMSNATSTAPLSILLEFTNGAATHRKVIKGLFASPDPEVTEPTIINDCVIRGPMGYGLRVTAGQTGTGAQIALWGKYGTVNPKTHPGTGVVPGASDAFDAQERFWVFSEATATGVYEIFPSTSVGKVTTDFVLDGYALSAVAADKGGTLISIANAATFQNMVPTFVTPLSDSLAVNVGSVALGVDDEADLRFRYTDRIGATVANFIGVAQSTSLLMWGRCGGVGDQNALSATSLAKRYQGGSAT